MLRPFFVPVSRVKTLRGTPRNLSRLARALHEGELVAVPTETVYGLAGHALDPGACRRIFRAKGRPTNDPLIIHIHALRQWDELAVVNEAARRVATALWPGPLTIVLPKRAVVPDIATSGLPSVAVRMPSHRLFRALLRKSGLPLAAPSANPFGYISPTTAAHVADQLGTRIPYILDGGPCAIGLESTILDLRDPEQPAILRPGAISAGEISRVLRKRIRTVAKTASPDKAAVSPGMLTQHYSPRTPLTLHGRLSRAAVQSLPANNAVLHLTRPKGATSPNEFWLSETGDLAQAAKHLFAKLRKLDAGNWAHLHALRPKGNSALAIAMNDRLTRAAAKR